MILVQICAKKLHCLASERVNLATSGRQLLELVAAAEQVKEEVEEEEVIGAKS